MARRRGSRGRRRRGRAGTGTGVSEPAPAESPVGEGGEEMEEGGRAAEGKAAGGAPAEPKEKVAAATGGRRRPRRRGGRRRGAGTKEEAPPAGPAAREEKAPAPLSFTVAERAGRAEPEERGDLRLLRLQVEELAERVGRLEEKSGEGAEFARYLLRRRGIELISANPREALLLPRAGGEKEIAEYYEQMKRYSFRLFLRDVIRLASAFTLKDLERYSSEHTIRDFMDRIIDWQIARRQGPAAYQLANQAAKSFGDTFEWFVAQIFRREFGAPTAWGIRARNARHGGDYDVVALVEGAFVYVEVKSSPPKHIEPREVNAFLDRVEDLRPRMAIFIEDTQLRMKDKILPMFEDVLKQRAHEGGKPRLMVTRMVRELFQVGEQIFIINSDPDVTTNLAECLRRAL